MTPAQSMGIPRTGRKAGWAGWFAPSLSDCLFVALMLWMLFFTVGGGAGGMLQDAGTGVHIRTGEYILDRGTVPRLDLFSFSRPGEPWFAWEWLSGVLFALVFRAGGLGAVVVFSAAVIALSCAISARHMNARSGNALVTIVLLHLLIGASSVHYLARPHVFTLALLAAAFWLIDEDRRAPGRAIWLLVPLTAVWTNLHGGFAGLLITLLILAAGDWIEWWLWAGSQVRARRYSVLAAACSLATLLNPYGWRLHAHLWSYLQAGWIRKVVLEFQPPRFESPGGRYIELMLLLAVLLAGWLLLRRRVAEALVILAWSHATLLSVRHAPVLALAAAPPLAEEIARWWRESPGVARTLAQLGRDHAVRFGRVTALGPVALAALFLLAPGAEFPREKYPADLVERHAALLRSERLFTMDAWADYLIYRFYPSQLVFFDGRTDFFGERLFQDYHTLLNGLFGWEDVIRRHNLRAALLPRECAAASLLRRDPAWRVVEETPEGVLLRR